MAVFVVRVFLVLGCQQVKAGKERRPDGEHHRYYAEEVLDVGDDRLICHGRVESYLVEVHAGEIEPACSPHLFFTVNVVNISVGFFPYPVAADLQEIIPVTESEDLLRTDLDAGGRQSILQAGVVAEYTLLDHRI